ncbi:MAG TPA: hypothetical protein VGM94_05135 [Galbitalea sp.]|jgi:hypothetical protein
MTTNNARPEWSLVARYTDNQKTFRERVEANGYRVVDEQGGFSVRRAGDRQVAIYVLTDEGKFRWGWIEVPNGRIDLYTEDLFLSPLTTHQPTSRKKN